MTAVQLPDPWDYCYEWDGPFGTRKFSHAPWNGRAPTSSVALFTADQLRAYGAACAAAEREACAQMCEAEECDFLARSIRARETP